MTSTIPNTTPADTTPSEPAEEKLLVDLTEFDVGTYDLEFLEFKVTPTCVVVKSNGVDKFISLDSFLSALAASSTVGEGDSIEGVLLPSNTFFFARTVTRIRLSCYYAGGVRNVKYSEFDRPSVVPNIIISHTLVKSGDTWSLSTSRYMTTDLPVSGLPNRFINSASASDRVFGLPFTNTYADGRMCYGGNSMPAAFRGNNLRGLDWYYQYLFETPFNDDLGLSALSNRQSPSLWYQKLATLASEGKPFPYNELSGYPEQS